VEILHLQVSSCINFPFFGYSQHISQLFFAIQMAGKKGLAT